MLQDVYSGEEVWDGEPTTLIFPVVWFLLLFATTNRNNIYSLCDKIISSKNMKSLLWIYLWRMFVISNQAFKVVYLCVW
jgi:hypothetical protein